MVITDTPGAAFDKVSLNIMRSFSLTRNGNQYILTMQNLLTKYSRRTLKRSNFINHCRCIFAKEFICNFGAPKAILTDQGANFLSALMRSLMKRFNIQHIQNHRILSSV